MLSRLAAVRVFQEVPAPESLASPLPGGIARVVRFFLDFPQPLQIAGVLIGLLAALLVAVLVWRRRVPLIRWLQTRPRPVYMVLVGLTVVAISVGVGVGFAGWHYVQHDNGFCTGCHVMGPAFVRFTESEHSQLECHDCHQQPVSASMRQLYLWVAERPEEIEPHAPVATAVCARCHVQDDADHTWEAIATTQGHAVHLNSDADALADVQCVTCHGREVHRFIPAEDTCGQSDCHSEGETRIALGEMSGDQTAFHCLACHEFTAPLADEAAVKGEPMLPTLAQCGGCHFMEPLVAEFMPGTDPHDAECGLCHNPHAQAEITGALESCTSGECHSDPQALSPFHRGLEQGVAGRCTECHPVHRWMVDGNECTLCHDEPLR